MIAAIAAALYARRAAVATEETVGIAREGVAGAAEALAIADRNAAAAVKMSEAAQEANRLARSAEGRDRMNALMQRITEESGRRADNERAEAAYTLARETAQKQLRAYIGTLGAALCEPESARPYLAVDLKNFGQTPAFDVVTSCVVNIFRRSQDGSAHRTVYSVESTGLGITEPGHGQHAGIEIDGPISPGTATGLILEMSITFRDVFDVKRWRRTTYELTNQSRMSGPDRIALNTAAGGNSEGEGEPPPTALVSGPDDPKA